MWSVFGFRFLTVMASAVNAITVNPTYPLKNGSFTLTATATGSSLTWVKDSTVLTGCTPAINDCDFPTPISMPNAVITVDDGTKVSTISVSNANQMLNGGLYDATGSVSKKVIVSTLPTSVQWKSHPVNGSSVDTGKWIAETSCVYPYDNITMDFKIFVEGVTDSVQRVSTSSKSESCDSPERVVLAELVLDSNSYANKRVYIVANASHDFFPNLAYIEGDQSNVVIFKGERKISASGSNEVDSTTYRLTCDIPGLDINLSASWSKHGNFVTSCLNSGCLPSSLSSYIFTQDASAIYLDFSTLKASEHDETWTCEHRFDRDSFKVTVDSTGILAPLGSCVVVVTSVILTIVITVLGIFLCVYIVRYRRPEHAGIIEEQGHVAIELFGPTKTRTAILKTSTLEASSQEETQLQPVQVPASNDSSTSSVSASVLSFDVVNQPVTRSLRSTAEHCLSFPQQTNKAHTSAYSIAMSGKDFSNRYSCRGTMVYGLQIVIVTAVNQLVNIIFVMAFLWCYAGQYKDFVICILIVMISMSSCVGILVFLGIMAMCGQKTCIQIDFSDSFKQFSLSRDYGIPFTTGNIDKLSFKLKAREDACMAVYGTNCKKPLVFELNQHERPDDYRTYFLKYERNKITVLTENELEIHPWDGDDDFKSSKISDIMIYYNLQDTTTKTAASTQEGMLEILTTQRGDRLYENEDDSRTSETVQLIIIVLLPIALFVLLILLLRRFIDACGKRKEGSKANAVRPKKVLLGRKSFTMTPIDDTTNTIKNGEQKRKNRSPTDTLVTKKEDPETIH